MNFRNLLWLFPIAVTLHNAEEAIWLPGWSKRAALWRSPVTPGTFRFAAAVLTVLIFAVTALSANSGKQTIWTYLLFGSMTVTLANVLIPHLALTVVLRSYMPGLATALVLNLPLLSLLMVLALREGYVSGWKAAAYSAGVAGITLAAVPILFKTGKILNL